MRLLLRVTALSAFCLLAATAAFAQQARRGNPEMLLDGVSVDQMIAEFMRDSDVPGLSVAIVQAPYITRATGFGVGDTGRKTLVSVNTMFNIAQMKNAFTGVAVMQLVEDGKLDLQAVLPLVRQPAEYQKLEALVEKAAGQPYQQFVRARQFAPLHLRHTFFASELESAPRELLAPGARHQRFLKEPALIDPSEPAEANGSGGAASSPTSIYASASDISVWDIALAGGILIKDPAHRKLLYEPPGAGDPSSGPWYFPGHQGLMVVTGSGEGFSSLLSRFTHRDELVCVTLLANREGLDLTQLARRIAGAHNGTIGPHAKGAAMRVQQSPYSVRDTIGRVERVLRSRGIGVTSVDAEHGTLTAAFGRVEAWADNGEVWVAAPDPVKAAGGAERAAQLMLRRTIDDALLQAIAPVDIR